MYKRYSRPEIFQVITANAALKMVHKMVAMINAREDGSTDIQVKFGKTYVAYGPDEQKINEKKINKSGKLTLLFQCDMFIPACQLVKIAENDEGFAASTKRKYL